MAWGAGESSTGFHQGRQDMVDQTRIGGRIGVGDDFEMGLLVPAVGRDDRRSTAGAIDEQHHVLARAFRRAVVRTVAQAVGGDVQVEAADNVETALGQPVDDQLGGLLATARNDDPRCHNDL